MRAEMDFLRDEERAPLEYDDAHHGFPLTDETYTLRPYHLLAYHGNWHDRSFTRFWICGDGQ